jgi:hypothetical protein
MTSATSGFGQPANSSELVVSFDFDPDSLGGLAVALDCVVSTLADAVFVSEAVSAGEDVEIGGLTVDGPQPAINRARRTAILRKQCENPSSGIGLSRACLR